MKLSRVIHLDPLAGSIIIWKRNSTELSVSRCGFYLVRGVDRTGTWVRAEDVPTFEAHEPLLPLARQWFKTFQDSSLAPISPALEEALFRLGQESLKISP